MSGISKVIWQWKFGFGSLAFFGSISLLWQFYFGFGSNHKKASRFHSLPTLMTFLPSFIFVESHHTNLSAHISSCYSLNDLTEGFLLCRPLKFFHYDYLRVVAIGQLQLVILNKIFTFMCITVTVSHSERCILNLSQWSQYNLAFLSAIWQ